MDFRKFCLTLSMTGLSSVGLLSSNAYADDALYYAVSDYLMKWNDFSFEAHQNVMPGNAQQAPRFLERNARGISQRNQGKRSWQYTVSLDDSYKYPLPGEVTPPLAGEFVLLPAGPSGGINDRSWQKRPGAASWEKVPATLYTLASTLETDHLFHATVIDSGLLMSAQPKGSFPVFGAEANKGIKATFYEITNAKPQGYRYGYWLDPKSRQLLQISVAKTERGENHDLTIGFWNVNKSGQPVIAAPAPVK